MRFLIAFIILIFSGCASSNRHHTLYDQIEIEVIQVGDASPNMELFNQFLFKISEYKICRLNNIRLNIHAPVSGFFKKTWSGSDLRCFRDKYRKAPYIGVNHRNLNICVLYVPGYHRDDDVVGLTFDRTNYAIFVDRMSNGDSETSVNLHELGHVIGIVDEEQRTFEKAKDPIHCRSKKCVMFFYVGTKLKFDTVCVNNLKRLIKSR